MSRWSWPISMRRLARYRTLGFSGGERFVLAEQAVEVATLRSGTGWIELIRPTDPDGPIARFLAKRGEGCIMSRTPCPISSRP